MPMRRQAASTEIRTGQSRNRLFVVFVCGCLWLAPGFSMAGTIVRVSTSIGDYSIELLDDVAPVTVENFLNYVERNAYNGTYLHRVVDDFVVQGGAYRFELFVGPVDVPTDPPIPNEFSTSNTLGTVAMAKLEGDPDSATNQWFVNLTDNTELDTSDGGFTVFGNVLGEGMAILEGIDELGARNLGSKAPSAPFFTETYNNPLDFVYINVEKVNRFSSAPHLFESASGLLITSVDVDNGEERIALNFNVVPDNEDFVIQANLESVIPRREFDGMATYDSGDTRLRIPSLEVNDQGDVYLVNNVVFSLVNTSPVQFVLESYELP